MKYFLKGLCLSACVYLSGCAALFRGSNEDVVFESDPPGADVRLSSGLYGKTPCTIPVPGRKVVGVIVEKDGHHSHHGYIFPFTYVDYYFDKVYDMKPNPYRVKLIPESASK